MTATRARPDNIKMPLDRFDTEALNRKQSPRIRVSQVKRSAEVSGA
jgi:hypothetical protein